MSDLLTPQQRLAVDALAAGQGLEKSAIAAGVSLRTLHRWRKRPEFAAGLRAADADHMSQTARILNAASSGAIMLLLTVMNDKDTAMIIRLRAASDILKHRAAFYELVTVSGRLDALENAVFQGTDHE